MATARLDPTLSTAGRYGKALLLLFLVLATDAAVCDVRTALAFNITQEQDGHVAVTYKPHPIRGTRSPAALVSTLVVAST